VDKTETCFIGKWGRRMKWEGHAARMGEERKMYRVLMGKPKGRRLLGRPSRRWEDRIRMDLGETEWGWSGFGWFE
jgi:hypothetical protein